MPTFVPKITWNSHAGAEIFEFTLPPDGDPFNEVHKPDWDIHVANSGNRTIQKNHVEIIWTPEFVFLTSAQKTSIQTFLDDWAFDGKEFRYYPSKESGTYYTVELLEPEVRWKRDLPDGSGDFIYSLTMPMRRVA